jgi:hypothetical protein
VVFEFDSGADHEVLDGSRYEHLSIACEGHDPGGDVHRQPSDVVAAEFDLPGVQASSDLDSQ